MHHTLKVLVSLPENKVPIEASGQDLQNEMEALRLLPEPLYPVLLKVRLHKNVSAEQPDTLAS